MDKEQFERPWTMTIILSDTELEYLKKFLVVNDLGHVQSLDHEDDDSEA